MRGKLTYKDKKGGVVTSTVMGIAGLIIGVIIALVIIQTLDSADLLGTADVVTITTINETGAWMNITGYTLAEVNGSTSGYVITAVWNETSEDIILAGNYTVGATGIFTNASASDFSTGNYGVNISYTMTYTGAEGEGKYAVGNLTSNFTDGIDNISTKVPTILLIVAVVFLFGALVLLLRNSKALGVGEGSSL